MILVIIFLLFFFSSRRRHTIFDCDWSSDVCSSDLEHGQNIEKAAAAQGIAPIELANRVVSRYHDLYRTFEISNDDFIRTTEPRHRAGVEALIARIEQNGDFYVDRHEGWYCASCEAFYTEKELD